MSRLFSWLLLGTFIVTAVTAGVDLYLAHDQRVPIPLTPPNAESSATYDVAVASTFLGDRAVEGGLAVHVGPIHKKGAAGDPASPWTTISTERHPAPWDLDSLPISTHPGPLVGAERHVEDEKTIRIIDGRIVEHRHRLTDLRWHDQKETWLAGIILDETHHPAAAGEPSAPDARHHHQDTTAYAPQSLLGRLIGTNEGDPTRKTPRAQLDGATVYGITHQHARQAAPAADFGCTVPFPAYGYSEAATTALWEEASVWSRSTVTTWVEPGVFFPRLAVCETVFREGGPDGGAIGTIRLALKRATHDPGTHSIVLGDAHTTPLATDPSAPKALPRNATGLPHDPAPLFLFPLDAAYHAVRQSDEATLAAFRNPHEPPFVVLRATYDPDQVDAPCDPDALLDCILDMDGERDPLRARPSWELRIQNDAGKVLDVRVVRETAETGAALPPEITTIEQARHDGRPLDIDAIPPDLVPPSALLARWLQDEERTVASWRSDPQAFYRLDHQTTTDSHRPDHQVGGSAETAPATELDDETTVVSRSYRGTDGALLTSSTRTDGYKKHTRPEGVGTAYHDHTADLDPYPYESTAALILGGLTTAAVAYTFRTSAPGWLRRLLVLPFFTKLTKKQVLDHHYRDAIIAYVTAHVGVRTEEVRQHLKVGWGTVVYHLSTLEDHQMLSSLKIGGHRHWYPARSISPKEKEAIALLRSPAVRRLHDAIQARPGATQQEIALQLGVTHGTVIFHVRRLERVGMIQTRRDGRCVRYYPRTATTDSAP